MKSTVLLASAFAIWLLSACARAQGQAEYLEALPEKHRFFMLEAMKDSELCSVYNKIDLKSKSTSQIEQILRGRKVKQCTAHGQVRDIPSAPNVPVPPDELTIPVVPSSFDIVGIRPGLSTEPEVLAIARISRGKEGDTRLYRIAIGGFDLPCSVTFEHGRVATLLCTTGRKNTTDDNAFIHEILAKGFTEKFGPPTHAEKIPVTNGLGNSFANSQVTWRDAAGSLLQLNSIDDAIDQGALLFLSPGAVKQMQKAVEERNARRKF